MSRFITIFLCTLSLSAFAQKQAIFKTVTDDVSDTEVHFTNTNNVYWGEIFSMKHATPHQRDAVCLSCHTLDGPEGQEEWLFNPCRKEAECMSCHNEDKFKFADNPDQACTQCHAEKKYRIYDYMKEYKVDRMTKHTHIWKKK